jgi:hypothetical protein
MLAQAILRKSSNVEYCTMVEEKGGVDKLEELQDHENEDVYRKAAQIIETFYADSGDEDDDDDVSTADASGDDFHACLACVAGNLTLHDWQSTTEGAGGGGQPIETRGGARACGWLGGASAKGRLLR